MNCFEKDNPERFNETKALLKEYMGLSVECICALIIKTVNDKPNDPVRLSHRPDYKGDIKVQIKIKPRLFAEYVMAKLIHLDVLSASKLYIASDKSENVNIYGAEFCILHIYADSF